MCGLVGILKNPSLNILLVIVEKMTADVTHRGPDDGGIVFLSDAPAGSWSSSSHGEDRWTVALGSRRLSILDLSSAGHMPMIYHNRYWIVYNGEVYNFIEIRTELEQPGHTFCSSSDTEVILAAYAEWGTDCFALFRGMWGMIIVDCTRNEVILCRDRLGIKPLYLFQKAGLVAVVSEIKQLLCVPGFTPRMNPAVVAEYLHTGYEDPYKSFFLDVQAVPAGSWLKIPLDTLIPSTPKQFWQPELVQTAVTDVKEAGRLLAEKLRESVRMHLCSDVPVGCALSGGMDSSSIAVLINGLLSGEDYSLHTFTSTFPGERIDEREYVDAVVAHIRAVPHYAIPNPTTFMEEFDHFLRIHDEPVGGLSVYAAYCIARLTREAGIPVTLSGQGGDEIFAGYWQSYFLYLRQLAKHGHILSLSSHFAGALIKGNHSLLTQIPIMLKRYQVRSNPDTLFHLCKFEDRETTSVLQKILQIDEQAWRVELIRSMFLPRFLKWDDRNSMAFSVEVRYPFLDHELIDLCLSFSSQMLYHNGWTKWPLRVGLRDTLPEKILHRRTKLGFEVPQDAWLCGPLRPILENWLKQDRPLWEYVNRANVRSLAEKTWQLHGKRNEPGQALFRLFVFDRWIEVFGVTE